jgi:hypothetical protein
MSMAWLSQTPKLRVSALAGGVFSDKFVLSSAVRPTRAAVGCLTVTGFMTLDLS